MLKESFEEYDVTAKTSSFLKDVFPEAHNYKESVGVMFDLGLNIVSDEEDCFVDFTGPETKHHLEHFLNNCNQDSENIKKKPNIYYYAIAMPTTAVLRNIRPTRSVHSTCECGKRIIGVLAVAVIHRILCLFLFLFRF